MLPSTHDRSRPAIGPGRSAEVSGSRSGSQSSPPTSITHHSVRYARMLISIIQSGRCLPVIVVLLREKKKVCSFKTYNDKQDRWMVWLIRDGDWCG